MDQTKHKYAVYAPLLAIAKQLLDGKCQAASIFLPAPATTRYAASTNGHDHAYMETIAKTYRKWIEYVGDRAHGKKLAVLVKS
jgi:hypothetical protein